MCHEYFVKEVTVYLLRLVASIGSPRPPVNANRALMTVIHATDFMHNGSNWVSAVAFNPKKENEVVSASCDCTIKVWSLADGQCKQTLEGHL